MKPIQTTLRQAVRRHMLVHGLRGLGIGFVVALCVNLMALALDRTGLLSPAIWWYFIAPGGAVLYGIVLTLAHRLSPFRIAVLLDQRLQSKDRLGTAVSLDQPNTETDQNPFARLARIESQQWAEKINIKSAIPHSGSRRWIAGLILLVLFSTTFLFMPRYDFRNRVDTKTAQQNEHYREMTALAQNAVRESAESIRATNWIGDQSESNRTDPTDIRTAEALDTLERLNEQLAQQTETDQPETADDLLTESAEALRNVADALDDESNALSKESDEVLNRLADLEPPGSANDSIPDSTDDLVDALRSGDLDRASEWLDSLSEQAEQLTPEQREALADRLSNMADQMSEQVSDEVTESTESPRNVEDRLRDLGVDEQTVDDLAERDFPIDEVAQTLEQEQKIDPLEAERIADQLHEQAVKEQAQQHADEQINELSENIEKLAESIEQQPDEPLKPDERQPNQPESNEQTTDPSKQDSDQSEQQPGESRDHPEDQSTQQQDDETGENAPSEQERETPTETDSETRTPDQDQSVRETPRQSDQPYESPSPDSPQQMIEQIKKQLEEVTESQRKSQEQRQISEDMRQRAEELLEQMSPEEQEELRKWGQQHMKRSESDSQQPPDPKTSAYERIEERGGEGRDPTGGVEPHPDGLQTDDEQMDEADQSPDADPPNHESGTEPITLAQWYRPTDESEGVVDPAQQTGSGAARSIEQQTEIARRLQQAAKAIEQSLSKEAIPPRYRPLIKKWADRMNKSTKSDE